MRFILFLTLILFSSQGLYANKSLNYINSFIKSNQSSMDKSTQRLAKGVQLLTDNPANYVIYEKMEKYVRGMDKLINNDSDMKNYYIYQDGVLSVAIKSLQRIRELSVRLQSGILASSDKSIIKNEMRQYYDQIIFQFKTSQFNSIKVFYSMLNEGEWNELFNKEKYYNIYHIDALLKFLVKQRTILGAKTNRLTHKIRGQRIARDNSLKAQSNNDTDFAEEITRMKLNEIRFQSQFFMLHSKLNMQRTTANQLMR